MVTIIYASILPAARYVYCLPMQGPFPERADINRPMRTSAPAISPPPAAKANLLTHLYAWGRFYLNVKEFEMFTFLHEKNPEVFMKYKVNLKKTEEGYAVWVPGLPGFWIARQGKHITMTNGERIITIPRANPINSFTMAGIAKK